MKLFLLMSTILTPQRGPPRREIRVPEDGAALAGRRTQPGPAEREAKGPQRMRAPHRYLI